MINQGKKIKIIEQERGKKTVTKTERQRDRDTGRWTKRPRDLGPYKSSLFNFALVTIAFIRDWS